MVFKFIAQFSDNFFTLNNTDINITSQCLRVPVSDGHTAAVFMSFKDKAPTVDEVIKVWESYKGRAQELKLPSAPKQFLHYFTEIAIPPSSVLADLICGWSGSVK